MGERRTEEQDDVGRYLSEIARTPLLKAEEEVELMQQIEAGQLARQIVGGSLEYNTPHDDDSESRKKLVALHMTPDELKWVADEGERAKDHMLRANLRLVVSIARRYKRQETTAMKLLDRVQEGNTGLIRAVEKFDYKKGFKFSTYATWWVRQAITRGIADQARTVRLPVHINEILNKIYRIQRDLLRDLDREPTDEEVAVNAELPVEKVQELLKHGRSPVSLNTPMGEDVGAGELGDVIADTVPESQAYAAFHETQGSLNELLDQALLYNDAVDIRIIDIMKMRFGLYDGDVWTLKDVGIQYGFSRERARQLESVGFTYLRAYAEQHNLTLSDYID